MIDYKKHELIYGSPTKCIIEDDIFKVFEMYDNVILCHVSNCFHTMGGGIAKIIRERYPKAYEADCRTVKGDKNKLGTYSFAKEKEKYIANIYGQYTYGQNYFGDRELSYDALYNGFQKLLKDIRNSKIDMVLVPYGLGCGLAKGRWEIVEKILDILAEQFKIQVVIVKLP